MMIPTNTTAQFDGSPEKKRAHADIAALVHFSDYIAKEAVRLGLGGAAEKARLVQHELLSALKHN